MVTPIMVGGDDRTIGTIVCDIGMMGGAKDTVLDERYTDERYMKDNCLDDRGTVEEDTYPGDTMVTITSAMVQQMPTPSIGDSSQPVCGGQDEVLVFQAKGW